MKITWINPANITRREGRPYSDRACVRLRCVEPALHLQRKSHDVNAVNIFNVKSWANDPSFYTSETYVVGKALVDLTPVLRHLKKLGKKVVVDVCDNIFEPPEDGLKETYTSILPLADTIVAASQNLASVLSDRIGGNVSVIPDHVEGRKLAPSFDPGKDKVRLLWFGYPSNLDLLHAFVPELGRLATDLVVELSIVTSWNNRNANLFRNIQTPMRIRRIEWSIDNMAGELARCDMVIIPSAPDPGRVTKTANRIMTSLYAGKYVTAFPLPTYLDFSPFVSLDKDLVRAVQFALENPVTITQRIADGQDFIDRFYSPDLITRMWEAALVGL